MMEKYELIRSNRKTIAIQIRGDGQVIVRAPLRMSNAAIQQFIAQKEGWIARHLVSLQQRQVFSEPAFTAAELQQLANNAREDIARRVACFAPLVGVSHQRITIRAQKTRWGSCSAKGNLNFNCLLMLCPEAVRDYVVVHELCHRKELNHSTRFWNEVASVLPSYEEPRKWLKANGNALIRRLP